MLYTGTLSDYRYEAFLDALAIFKKREPLQAARLSVKFVGEGVERRRWIGSRHWDCRIVSHPAPIPHAEIGGFSVTRTRC